MLLLEQALIRNFAIREDINNSSSGLIPILASVNISSDEEGFITEVNYLPDPDNCFNDIPADTGADITGFTRRWRQDESLRPRSTRWLPGANIPIVPSTGYGRGTHWAWQEHKGHTSVHNLAGHVQFRYTALPRPK